MKFHSNLKTVGISLLVLLLFVFTSIFILSELNLTSPTLIVASRLFEDIENKNSDIGITFSSMERNFRDRVKVNDLSIFYKGDRIASFKDVEVKTGILDLLSYFLWGRITPTLVVENGEVIIPQSLFSTNSNNVGQTTEGSGNLDFLEKFKFELSLSKTNIVFEELGKIENVSLNLDFGGSLDDFVVSLAIPELDVNYGEYKGKLHSIEMELDSEEEKALYFRVKEGEVASEKFSSKIDNINGSLAIPSFNSISFDLVTGVFGFDNASINYDEYNVDINHLKGSVVNKDFTFNIEDIELNAEGIYALASNVDLGVDDLEKAYFNISSLNGNYKDYKMEAKNISLDNLVFSTLNGNLTLSSLEVIDTLSLTGNTINSGRIDNLSSSFNIGERSNINFEFTTLVIPENNHIGNIDATFIGDVHFEDMSLTSFNISSKSLYLGIGEREGNSFNFSGNLDGANLSLKYGKIAFDLDGSYNKREVKGNINVDNYNISIFMPIINDYFPSFSSFIKDDTSLILSLGFDFTVDNTLPSFVRGPFNYSLTLNDLTFSSINTFVSSAASIEMEEDRINLKKLNLETSFFTLETSGRIKYDSLLPELSFVASSETLGEIISGEFNLENTEKYVYSFNIPILSNSALFGELDFGNKEIIGNGIYSVFNENRPFSFSYDLNNKNAIFNSTHINGNINTSNGIFISLGLSQLDYLRNGTGNPIYLGGDINFSWPYNESFSFSANDMRIEDIWLFPSSPDISFNAEGNQEEVTIKDISIYKDEETFFTGMANYNSSNTAITLTLDEINGQGDIILSFFKDDMYSGLIRARNLDMSLFGWDDLFCNMNLTGRASRIEDLTLEGSLEVLSLDRINDDRIITADLNLTNDTLLLDNIRYTTSGFSLSVDSVRWNSGEGKLTLSQGDIFMKGEHNDRDYPISMNFSLSMEMENNDNLYYSLYNLIRDGGEGLSFTLSLNKLDLDNSKILVENKYTSGRIKDRKINLEGSLIDGEFILDDYSFDIGLHLMPLLDLEANGSIKNGIVANADINAFNMYFVNMFMVSPLITFDENFVQGEVGIVSNNGTYNLSGNLWSEELGVGIFWIPDQKVFLHNPHFDMWDNKLICSVAKTTVMDYTTYERKTIDMYAGLTLTPTLSLEGYDVEIWMDENNPIRVRIPLPDSNVDIISNGYGHYYMKTIEGEPMINEGELSLTDSVVSIGMNPYPDWYELTGKFSMDMKFNFLRNNKIIYPAGDNPILSITIDENSSISAQYSPASFSVLGDLYIRGGEIYYFQKYFYITEGSISFPDGAFNPRINLTATLRDYDSDSNRVEIYLVMKDNTFDNLSPTLESLPAKELSEIMEILGQSIIPTNDNNNNVGSVASLVTEGIDILGKLGIITTQNPVSQLTTSLKEAFGVDSFSIHSNIMNNIITDTLVTSLGNQLSTFSPMARYLDGTTLTIGKYLSSNFYLQGMIHLVASKNARNKYTLISDDLVLDTEFSLEWMNPAFKITFYTSPNYFSLYSIMDTFKFSITKTLNW